MIVEERRPGWIQDLPPDERWRINQASAWEWALYVRSDQYGYGLPACLEDAHRRVLAFVRWATRWRARAVLVIFDQAGQDTWSPGRSPDLMPNGPNAPARMPPRGGLLPYPVRKRQ